MRKVILYIASSVDGYIARKDGDVDWLVPDPTFDFKEFDQTVDTVIMGYKTYEKSLTFGEEVFKGKQYYVYTRKHLDRSDPRVEFINEDISVFVDKQKALPGKDIWLMGGGDLISSFLQAGVVDEMMLFIFPRILADGIPLFTEAYPELEVKLVDTNAYKSGLVELKYEIIKK